MSFSAREATIEAVHKAIFSDRLSCRDVVQAFLARIEEHNPRINAIISLNPAALTQADALDDDLAKGSATGKLFGVPILLKDNFDAVGMSTTAGSLAFKDLRPSRDASVVEALRKEGAIILGKTNLHEFALEGLTVSSLGGQTRNPYDLTRTPGGSSGGSGAAIAASFAVMATGTDTVNSLRSPASANSLYSFRPTSGLISRKGVVPVSSSQDAIGMIGRSLQDLWTALMVMSDTTLAKCENTERRYATDLDGIDQVQASTLPLSRPLTTIRVGVLQDFFDRRTSPETDPVNQAMDKVCSVLRTKGAVVVEICQAEVYDTLEMLSTMDTQMYEISELIDDYLNSSPVCDSCPSSFSEIFEHEEGSTSNNALPTDSKFLVIPSQYEYIKTALISNTSSLEYLNRKVRISLLTQALRRTFDEHGLDALIYPQQRNLVVPIGSPTQYGRNGILAALTGSPVICIPAGFSQPTSSAPIGVPIGMEVLGLPRTEARLFEVARAIDEQILARRPPVTYGLDEPSAGQKDYDRVPELTAQGLSKVDVANYPLGVL